MLLYTAKSQHLKFVRIACPFLFFPGPNGVHIPIPQANRAKDLGILANNSLSPTAQIDAMVAKSRVILTLIQHAYKRLTPHLFILSCSTMLWPNLEYCVQNWAFHLIHNIAKLEKVWANTRCVPGLMHLSYPACLIRLKHFRRRGDLIETFKILCSFVLVEANEFFSLRESRNQVGS